MGYEVILTLNIKAVVFWVVGLRNLVKGYRCLRETKPSL
jgi:hypothetical protein